jgi:cyclopropane-fatty-acyl-phospholipid synthase
MFPTPASYGGSSDAVEYHYDVSQAFYELWLDDSLTYSCALWNDSNTANNLNIAQRDKVRFHLDAADVRGGSHLLDIGCGWGALLYQACEERNADSATGLTLSRDQFRHVTDLRIPGAEVRLEHWANHRPSRLYDSIISIGAFEHFAQPEQTIEEKIAVYADFFRRCREWLMPGGRMSLQTIAYGTMKREEASDFINNEIFPAADLPTPGEILAACDGLFEITSLVNHRLHYARTLEIWAARLTERRDEAVRLVGMDVTSRYERYLKQTAVGFHMGKIGLLRLALRPITGRWKYDANWGN